MPSHAVFLLVENRWLTPPPSFDSRATDQELKECESRGGVGGRQKGSKWTKNDLVQVAIDLCGDTTEALRAKLEEAGHVLMRQPPRAPWSQAMEVFLFQTWFDLAFLPSSRALIYLPTMLVG